MKARLDPFKAAPAMMQGMLHLQKVAQESGLEHSLIELVKIRASQINGCAYCIHMHTKDARAYGETEERLYLVSAWRESPLFTDRERAALAWTEALTLLADSHAPDEVYDQLKDQFSDEEQVKLTLMIVAINGWNRFAVGFRSIHPVAKNHAQAA